MASKAPRKERFADLSGLSIVGGLQKNDRPDSMAPVTQAAIMRKERMRQEKIQMMEEAYVRAEMRTEMMEKLMGNGESES